MQTIVINRCPRMVALLSNEGLTEYVRRKFDGTPPTDFAMDKIARDDPVLVQLMQENMPTYGGPCAQIKLVVLPDEFKWKLMRQGTSEWIAADV